MKIGSLHRHFHYSRGERMNCEQCGDKAESEMIKHAKKNNQPVLCKGCDDYFSKLGKINRGF